MKKNIKVATRRDFYSDIELNIIRECLLANPSNFTEACETASKEISEKCKIFREPERIRYSIYHKKNSLYKYLTENPLFQLKTSKVNFVVNRRVTHRRK